jgi:histidyl-tRNA synthetase
MIKAITGIKDILPSEIPSWSHLEEAIHSVFKNYNYKEIRTPVFEETTLFSRGIGEETDIVGKEMYTFTDRSGTSVTLKPEMTAAVVRAYVEHSLGKQQPLNKLYYISPMFRQERPQAGRLRQFHQFGGEAIGSSSPLLDVEMIDIAYNILNNLGLKDILVKINSLGIPGSRERYKEELRNYLAEKKEMLSEDSRRRFDKNILRIFDSKIDNDQNLLKDAPLILDYLDDESKSDFDMVQSMLERLNIPFEIDQRLVRGLDYYTKTTFEIISGSVGSQNALCGGGRYDLLIEQLGGEPTPGVGFAAGIERILLACENENVLNLPEDKIDVYFVLLDNELKIEAFELVHNLRSAGFKVDLDYMDRSVKAQMREANKYSSRFVIFIGGEEYASGKMNVKNMQDGNQFIMPLGNSEELIKWLVEVK